MDAIEFTEAFYGSKIPESKKNVASIEIIRLVSIMKNDLRLDFQNATSEELDIATKSVLIAMRQRGMSSPKIYYEKNELVISAYQMGVEKLREMLRDREQKVDVAAWETERLASKPVQEIVWERYAACKAHIKDIGVTEDIAFQSWKMLVDRHLDSLLDLGGYAFFLVAWKIPQSEGIFDHEELIDICNAEPRLQSLKRAPSFKASGASRSISGMLSDTL